MRKALAHLRAADPVLAGIIDRVGPYTIQYREPVFETLVRSIVFQQLSGKAAGTIFGRLEAAVGPAMTPQAILKLTPRKMQSLGLSGQKQDYIRDLARKTAAGELDFGGCRDLSDGDVIERFTTVKGIGVWTVHMFLIFALRRPDVLPTGDLGVRAAIQKAYQMEAMPTPAEMEKIGAGWRPYCSVASWYLWRSLDSAAQM